MMPLLVLFDIDGTLLRPCGLGRRSLDDTFSELYGHRGVFDGVRFHGRTDPEILGDGLRSVGAPSTDFERVVECYLVRLEEEVRNGPSLTLPGVRDVLLALAARGDVVLGLVTGNVRRGAEIKLTRDHLWSFFPVGAFGDDDADRTHLIRIARERAETERGEGFSDNRVYYIGDTERDTERDVEAARGGGAVAIAVATGSMDADRLAEERPDHLLTSLEGASGLLEVLP